MDRDAFTRWDRLPITYPGLHEGVRGPDDADCLLRCVARIEPFELAARAVRDRRPADPTVRSSLEDLAVQYRARSRAWQASAASDRTPGGGWSLLLAAVGAVGPASLFALAVTDDHLAGLRTWPAVLITLPLLLPMSFIAAAGAVRLAIPSLTLEESLSQRRCPDCAWPLAHAKPAIDPRLIAGVNTGPDACTRCRRPWPLLPPPAGARLGTRT